MISKKLTSIATMVILSLTIAGCTNNKNDDAIDEQSKPKSSITKNNSEEVKAINKKEEKSKPQISQENKAQYDQYAENLFTGVWVNHSDERNMYCKFKKDRLEYQSSGESLNMHFIRIDKIEKDYKDNSLKLTITNYDQETSTATVKFINENEIKLGDMTYQRVTDKNEVAKVLARTYGIDFESLETYGLDEFLDLSRSEFFELFGMYIYNGEITQEQVSQIQANMTPEEAKSIAMNNLKGSYLDNGDLRISDPVPCQAGTMLGYQVTATAGDAMADNYGGRGEFFVNAKTKQMGDFETGFGYFDMGNYDEEFFNQYYSN